MPRAEAEFKRLSEKLQKIQEEETLKIEAQSQELDKIKVAEEQVTTELKIA